MSNSSLSISVCFCLLSFQLSKLAICQIKCLIDKEVLEQPKTMHIGRTKFNKERKI